MLTPLLLQLHEYALINGSFSDDIGLFTGKSAVALVNYEWSAAYQEPYYSDTVGYSFLEEIIAGSSRKTALHYGDGLMGFGSLVDYLQAKNQVDANSREVLENYEPICFALLPTIKETGLLRGIAGVGMYLLSRFKNQYNQPVFEHHASSCLAAIDYLAESAVLDNSLWTGWPGVLFFLRKLSKEVPKYAVPVKNITHEIHQKILVSLNVDNFKWDNFHALFALSRSMPIATYAKTLSTHLAAVPNQISNLPIRDGAFIALLLHLMSQENPFVPEIAVQKENIVEAVKNSIKHVGINIIFPFNPITNMVQVGLQGGVVGTLLPFLSIEENCFDWLQLIGIEV